MLTHPQVRWADRRACLRRPPYRRTSRSRQPRRFHSTRSPSALATRQIHLPNRQLLTRLLNRRGRKHAPKIDRTRRRSPQTPNQYLRDRSQPQARLLALWTNKTQQLCRARRLAGPLWCPAAHRQVRRLQGLASRRHQSPPAEPRAGLPAGLPASAAPKAPAPAAVAAARKHPRPQPVRARGPVRRRSARRSRTSKRASPTPPRPRTPTRYR